MFYQWHANKEKILDSGSSRRRVAGGGRKPLLQDLENLIADEVVELRIQKIKVTRAFIADRARLLAEEHGIEFRASNSWLDNFMLRHDFALRRTTNLTTLTDDQLIQRAVDYMTYLRSRIPYINLSKTLLMDETAVYCEDARTQTVDIRGRRHVVMKSTGFASMRITVVASVWDDGRKASPLVIHKGNDGAVEAAVTSNSSHSSLSTNTLKCTNTPPQSY